MVYHHSGWEVFYQNLLKNWVSFISFVYCSSGSAKAFKLQRTSKYFILINTPRIKWNLQRYQHLLPLTSPSVTWQKCSSETNKMINWKLLHIFRDHLVFSFQEDGWMFKDWFPSLQAAICEGESEGVREWVRGSEGHLGEMWEWERERLPVMVTVWPGWAHWELHLSSAQLLWVVDPPLS